MSTIFHINFKLIFINNNQTQFNSSFVISKQTMLHSHLIKMCVCKCLGLCPLEHFRLTRASSDLCTEYQMSDWTGTSGPCENVRRTHLFIVDIAWSHKVRWLILIFSVFSYYVGFVFFCLFFACCEYVRLFVEATKQVHFSWMACIAKNQAIAHIDL